MFKNRSYSFLSIAFTGVFLLSIFFYYDLPQRNRITLDAPSYYTYLPAVILHQDLKLTFIDQDPGFYKDKIWYYRISNGNRLIKHPAGISVMLSPFFIAGHLYAKLSGAPQTGYSMPYQNAVSIGVLFYLLAGLYFLRKVLLLYFSDEAAALTLLGLCLGTNLLWYATFEALMPHAISFALLCAALHFYLHWLGSGSGKHLFLFCLVFGLMVLVRPLALTLSLYFLLHAGSSKGGTKALLSFLKPQIRLILSGAGIILLIVSVQLCYWKYISGKWIFDVYMDEPFIFSSPQMLPFLFSFRKGLFVYTPILLFFIAGLFFLYKDHKAFFYSTILIFLLTIFLLSSWWAWSYGICWGMRPMIDYYPVLSIPMAAAFSFFLEGKWKRVLFYILFILLICLNLFQTWQYKNGLIHYDDMSREAYFKGFFQTKASAEWVDLLKPYDWERRIKGLPQPEYSEKLLKGLSVKDAVSLRGYNLAYITMNPKAENALASYSKKVGEHECFFIQWLGEDQVCIRAANGKLWSVHPGNDRLLMATELSPGEKETFLLEYLKEGDNRIALRSWDGKYVSAGTGFPFLLKADGAGRGRNEIFRFYMINEQL